MARMVEPVRPGATIQHAAPADLPRLLEIRYAAFSAQAPLAYSAQEVENLLGDVDEDELREMIRNRQVFIVRTGGRVVGLAGWKGPYLRHVYVDPGHTRRGIGTMLLSRVEADFRDRTGAGEIRAGVGLQAEPFYLANGYELVERARAWDDSEFLWMAKQL